MTEASDYIQREERLASYEGPDRVVHFTDYIKLKQEENQKIKSFKSGFSSFDEKMGGLATGEVTVISGRTGEGKTLFAESLMRKMIQADDSVKACMFSFEVSPFTLLMKYQEDQRTPLYVPQALEAMNIDWLADRILEAKIKYDCRFFVLDHLHYLVDMAVRQNMSLNIGAFMRRLKFEIATQMNVAVLLIAHQDKGDKKDEASLEGIRDSTFIAQEADNVVIVSRKKDFLNVEIDAMPKPAQEKIRHRMPAFPDLQNPFSQNFATVQIAKARRMGTFRWPKLFQKVGNFLEEV